MLPMGYLYKHVVERPEWLHADNVIDIYSLGGCMSAEFDEEYIQFWKHNGHWLFDAPEIIELLAAENGIDLEGTTLFYYEVFEQEYDPEQGGWLAYTPEASSETAVRVPTRKTLAGYDVVSFYVRSTPEHSPLSCNGLAEQIPTNAHCLLKTLEEARDALERGGFDNSEPGPYRIIAVYCVEER